ncbi:MAG: inositol monophosphatase family protein [Actinomycetes bacterium]|jgi:myo-inositol-1(or 4)-monophosphatase|nr:inositol monophosphatase [Acidimicrobiia bacterium]
MTSDLDVALRAARAGAEVVRRGFTTRFDVELKGAVDPVTVVDKQAEEAIFDVICRLRPDDQVLGEESGGAGWDSDRVWIVDPLDGTVNFIHGLPQVAVSVAVWENGEPVAGAVVDVSRGEEFAAARGAGATLDGEPIRVSPCEQMSDALVATGFPYDRQQRADAYVEVVAGVLREAQGMRRIGSAALDICWVACGRFDGYWEFSLAPWDMAAGVLVLQEAGGKVTDHLERPYVLGSPVLVASNGRIHSRLAEIVATHLPEHLR